LVKALKTGAQTVRKTFNAQSKHKTVFLLWYQNKQSVVSSNESVVLVLTVQPFEKQFLIFSKNI